MRVLSIPTVFAAAALFMVSACEAKEDSGRAASDLADAVFPGELELQETHFRTTHYDVTMRRRDDPLVRATFRIDPDPADCIPGSPCEARLRDAYQIGIARAAALRAIERAFSTCNVPVLGLNEGDLVVNPPPITPIVEQDLGRDQNAELARLEPCLAALWSDSTLVATPLEFLGLHILLTPAGGPSPAPRSLDFDSRVPEKRLAEARYMLHIMPGESMIPAGWLQFAAYEYPVRQNLREAFSDAARDYVRGMPGGAQTQGGVTLRELVLDAERIELLHGYVLACLRPAESGRSCRSDTAIRVSHDLTTGQTQAISHIDLQRDAGGSFVLPELPGRSGRP